MKKRRQLAYLVLFVILGFGLCSGLASQLIQIPFSVVAAETEEFAGVLAFPAGEIADENIDGIIGPEWDDIKKKEMQLGRYQADVYLKNDGLLLYVGMVINTGRRFGAFEAYFIFDSGDGINYNTEDDIASLKLTPPKEEQLQECDFYYRRRYDFREDTSAGGTNDVWGAGRFDAENHYYIFEFKKKLDSGDKRDVALRPGDIVSTIFGWAAY